MYILQQGKACFSWVMTVKNMSFLLVRLPNIEYIQTLLNSTVDSTVSWLFSNIMYSLLGKAFQSVYGLAFDVVIPYS